MDYSHLQGKWIAFESFYASDKLIAVGDSPEEVCEKCKEKGILHPYVTYIRSEDDNRESVGLNHTIWTEQEGEPMIEVSDKTKTLDVEKTVYVAPSKTQSQPQPMTEAQWRKEMDAIDYDSYDDRR